MLKPLVPRFRPDLSAILKTFFPLSFFPNLDLDPSGGAIVCSAEDCLSQIDTVIFLRSFSVFG